MWAGALSFPGTLDGEWIDGQSVASGDGAAGGNLVFRFNVLPGDVDRSGLVDGGDVMSVRGLQFSQVQMPGYGPFRDTNGSGAIMADDSVLARNRQLNTLPAGEPLMVSTAAPLKTQMVIAPAPPIAVVSARLGAVRLNLVRPELVASYWFGRQISEGLRKNPHLALVSKVPAHRARLVIHSAFFGQWAHRGHEGRSRGLRYESQARAGDTDQPIAALMADRKRRVRDRARRQAQPRPQLARLQHVARRRRRQRRPSGRHNG